MKILKSKNREILKLKNEVSSLNKTVMTLKTTTNTNQSIKSDRDKDRLKIGDLLKQRVSLETQVSKCKSDLFTKDTEILKYKSEIDSLKQQLQDQKRIIDEQKITSDKYRDLYMNAKSSMTPFSDSKLDNVTEATQYFKQTPTEMRVESSKQNQDLKVKDIKDKDVVERKVIKQSSIIKPHAVPEVEKKLEIKSQANKVIKEEESYSEYDDDVNEDIKIEIEPKVQPSPAISESKVSDKPVEIIVNKPEDNKTKEKIEENKDELIETPK